MSSIDPDLAALARMMVRQHAPGEIIRAVAAALAEIPEVPGRGFTRAQFDGRGEQIN